MPRDSSRGDAASARQARPNAAPTKTSVGWCRPRYDACEADEPGEHGRRERTERPHESFPGAAVTINATPTQSTVAAAVWPDGKLDVAGVELSRGTSGRGRATTNVTDKNTVISRTSARIRKAASRKRRRERRKPGDDGRGDDYGQGIDAPGRELVTSFQPLVRCTARLTVHVFVPAAHLPSRACVSRKPIASRTAVSCDVPADHDEDRGSESMRSRRARRRHTRLGSNMDCRDRRILDKWCHSGVFPALRWATPRRGRTEHAMAVIRGRCRERGGGRVVAGLLAWRLPNFDPATPAVAADRRSPRRSRLTPGFGDSCGRGSMPQASTGLGLTVALATRARRCRRRPAALLVMVQHNAGLARYDLSAARWGREQRDERDRRRSCATSACSAERRS